MTDGDLEEFGTEPKKKNKGNQARVSGGLERALEQDSEEEKSNKTQWEIWGSGKYFPTSDTTKNVPAGYYVIRNCNRGLYMQRLPLDTDDLMALPGSIYDDVIKEVDNFWKLGDRFKKYGFLHRRGYLLYGPAGSGKSCLVKQICSNIITEGDIVLYCDSAPDVFTEGLRVMREVEPTRRIVCVFEDIDSHIDRFGEQEILSILDGENQVDQVLNIATTNYPEKLDKRIVSRPRRFDRVIKIKMPNEEARRIYFTNKLKINGGDEEKWVKLSEGFSFAAMAEMVISVKCLGNKLEATVEKLRKISKTKYSSTEFDEAAIGFTTKK